MKKKMMLFLILIMAVFLTAASPAHAWDGKGKECSPKMGKEHGQCPITEKFMRKAHFLMENKAEIGLTDDQVKAIKELKLQAEKDSVRQFADMKTFMLDLQYKLSEDKVDVEGANKLIDKNFAEVSAAAKAKVEVYAKLKGLLSSEQIKKMKAIHEQMEKKEKAEGEKEERGR